MDNPDPLLSELCSIWYLFFLSCYPLLHSLMSPPLKIVTSILPNTAAHAAPRAPALSPAPDAINSGPSAPASVIQPHIYGATSSPRNLHSTATSTSSRALSARSSVPSGMSRTAESTLRVVERSMPMMKLQSKHWVLGREASGNTRSRALLKARRGFCAAPRQVV